jgi:anti-anti-sigma regulatory factor
MSNTICFEDVMRKVEATSPCELTELVRGADRSFVEQMTPFVRRQSIALDLSSVRRIDAAGIAALISLYRIAFESGHRFSVSHAAPHVAELLALVGLDGFLLSHPAKSAVHPRTRIQQTAA